MYPPKPLVKSCPLLRTSCSKYAVPTLLSSLVNEGFTGTYIGMYASSNHTASKNHADYDWVVYEGIN